LLKGVTDAGFSFYTNYQSRKGAELEHNKNVALTFFWPALGRQIRIEGAVQKTGDADSDAYFATRPRLSQLGAWASRQSRVLKGREELEDRLRALSLKFRGKPVPRPPHWGGYLVTPAVVEFWQIRPSRLHDRIVYQKDRRGAWKITRLSP
jgi:pyridoxamine 5'-phosphate oxidase